MVRHIQIDNISSQYVDQLKQSLGKFPYYFILAGYDDPRLGEQLLPVADYNLCRAELRIDGATVLGCTEKHWPVELFRAANYGVLKEE